jgi:homoserine kinase
VGASLAIASVSLGRDGGPVGCGTASPQPAEKRYGVIGMKRATAFAPASIGNVAAGFDLLGLAFPLVGDRATVERIEEPRVVVEELSGSDEPIPMEAEKNTAAVALGALREHRALDSGFRIWLHKGIPLASGMGGSASSAVAAVVAANALLDEPLSLAEQCSLAVEGEQIASGSRHADNVAPSLYGGLCLVLASHRVVRVPVPEGLHCVLVHPHHKVHTREAREVLSDRLPLADHVRQSACLASLLVGCHSGDLELLRFGLRDLVVEPQRARLIPGFSRVQTAALEAGALGCSISGAGPSLFAWAESEDRASTVMAAMVEAFAPLACEAWRAPIGGPVSGARLVEP